MLKSTFRITTLFLCFSALVLTTVLLGFFGSPSAVRTTPQPVQDSLLIDWLSQG